MMNSKKTKQACNLARKNQTAGLLLYALIISLNCLETYPTGRSHATRGLDEQPTVHEGVIARALEAKGVVSDRCELNRQIKRDNALLREIKAQVRKLMQAVKTRSLRLRRPWSLCEKI